MTRRNIHASCLLVALVGGGIAAQPAPVLPQPAPSPTPAPSPAPKQGDPVVLNGDALYVVNSPVDAVARFHPSNLVRVTQEKGPIRIRGKFAGSSGLVETKSFDGPFVWIAEAAGKGRVEVDVIPKGFKDEKEITFGLIDVDSGLAPRPPPIPPDPKPPVPPDPKPVAKTFRVVFVSESEQSLTAAQKSVVYGKDVADYLNANCTKEGAQPGWRRYDKDTNAVNEQPNMKALWGAVKPQVTSVPCVAVERDGKVEIIPLDATPAAMIITFDKYRGQ